MASKDRGGVLVASGYASLISTSTVFFWIFAAAQSSSRTSTTLPAWTACSQTPDSEAKSVHTIKQHHLQQPFMVLQ